MRKEDSQPKSHLRQKFLGLRKDFAHSQHDESICQRLIQLLKTESGIWGGYIGTKTEPKISSAIQKATNIKWAYPKVFGDEMKFLVPKNEQSFSKGEMGILEPDDNSQDIDKHLMSGILIPAVAFDSNGHRLGRGKGYYDRFLNGWSGKKIGIAYSVQISSVQLPLEPHDVKMDVIVTDKEVLRISA